MASVGTTVESARVACAVVEVPYQVADQLAWFGVTVARLFSSNTARFINSLFPNRCDARATDAHSSVVRSASSVACKAAEAASLSPTAVSPLISQRRARRRVAVLFSARLSHCRAHSMALLFDSA